MKKHTDVSDEEALVACARAAHECNRAYCLTLGDLSQVSWEDAPQWQKISAIQGARGVLAGDGPRASHARWMQEKLETGWRLGPEKDPERREHLCLVPYDDLPAEQREKDKIFVGVVVAMAGIFPVLEAGR